MVSDAKKKRDAAKKAKAGKPGSAKESPAVSTSAVRASGRPAYAVNGWLRAAQLLSPAALATQVQPRFSIHSSVAQHGVQLRGALCVRTPRLLV